MKTHKETLERNRLWKQKNKTKVSDQGKRYYLKNKSRINLKQMLYARNGGNLKRYNLTLDGYKNLLKEQGNVCAICKGPEVLKLKGVLRNLAVDHDHITGKVRGILCSGCNRGIGYLKDNSKVLISAFNYLKKYGN